MNKDHVKLSKYLCLILRHRPEVINIELDGEGWAYVDDLIAKVNEKEGRERLTLDLLKKIVAEDNKTRFAFYSDGSMIRASQGHSIPVDLNYQALDPPEILYHGTVDRFLGAIGKQGLKRMKRHHVHLSADFETANNVGGRRGKAVVLEIEAKTMSQEGYNFYVSDNGVWLTDHVPTTYLKFPEG